MCTCVSCSRLIVQTKSRHLNLTSRHVEDCWSPLLAANNPCRNTSLTEGSSDDTCWDAFGENKVMCKLLTCHEKQMEQKLIS